MRALSAANLGHCGGIRLGRLGMKARRLIKGASFEPETVEAMGQAFDDAWARIARMFGTNSARLTLAEAMQSVATDGCTDVVALRADALHAMATDARFRPETAFRS